MLGGYPAGMITELTGVLKGLEPGRARVAMAGGVVLEVLLPGFAVGRLGGVIGEPVTLFTTLFLESQNQGATFTPRLAGFLSPEDRAFYELLTTVKGIGQRKALRSMTLPAGQIAEAIMERDVKLLQTLPEVGKRTAETIVVTLKDKVDEFVGAAARIAHDGDDSVVMSEDAKPVAGGGIVKETLEVLVQLGEPRAQALAWIEEVLSKGDRPDTVEALIAEVMRVKA